VHEEDYLGLVFAAPRLLVLEHREPVAGQAKSGEPSSGAGSVQLPSPNSEDQGGTGVKGSAQNEGATNKDTAPRDTMPR
jgi:hypothetical protein